MSADRPAAADTVRQTIKSLVQGVGDQQLAEVRNNNEYRKAYDPVVDSVANSDRQNTQQFCAETLHQSQ